MIYIFTQTTFNFPKLSNIFTLSHIHCKNFLFSHFLKSFEGKVVGGNGNRTHIFHLSERIRPYYTTPMSLLERRILSRSRTYASLIQLLLLSISFSFLANLLLFIKFFRKTFKIIMQIVLVNLKSEDVVPITAWCKYNVKRPLLARSGQASGLSGLLQTRRRS